MDQEKSIKLTLVQPRQEEEEEIRIDFGLIFAYLKRFFALWLALAVGLGAIAGGIGLLLQETMFAPKAETLIGFTYSGASSGLAPDGSALDVSRIRSPRVLMDALDALGIELTEINTIAENLSVDGITSESHYRRMTFYKDLLDKGADLELVDKVLSESNAPSIRYVVSFDYRSAGYSYLEGIQILNQVIDSYREYFEITYNRNTPLGNPISIIDYRDYDFAEAISIFSSALYSAQSYLDSLASAAPSFRSSRTGYSFSDLSKITSMLREVELDRASSYVILHSVTTNDIDTAISFYQWRIENLERSRTVTQTTLETLRTEIAAYEKDPVLYVAGEGNAAISSVSDTNSNYDNMINEELSAQSSISSDSRTIEYYQDVIQGFRDAQRVKQSDVERVQTYLASLNEKLLALLENVNQTADDYYEVAMSSNSVTTVVPAVVNRHLITKNAIMVFVGVEAVLLVWYIGLSVIKGLKDANAKEKKQKAADSSDLAVSPGVQPQSYE